MRKRRSIILQLLLVGIILASMFLVIMISTNEKLEKQKPAIYTSLEDFKTKKVTEAYKNMLYNVDKKVQLEIDEQELNDLIAIAIQDYEKRANAVVINGYSSQIATDVMTIRLDSKLLNLVPTQYVLKIKPSIEDNKLRLFVSEFKVGKISINPQTILKQIKASDKGEYYVDLKQQSIVLENKYSQQIILNDITLKQGTVSMNIELSIKNVKDLINVLGKLLPEGLQGLVE
ncbi:MAG TPA: hypothetical protein VIK78_07670 [Ruminiclostridium sp.]